MESSEERAPRADAAAVRTDEGSLQKQSVLSKSGAQHQQFVNENMKGAAKKNQCTSVSPLSPSTPMRAMDIRESNPLDAGLSPGLPEAHERLDSKLATTAKLTSPNSRNEAQRASVSFNAGPQPVLVTAHLVRAGHYPKGSAVSMGRGAR